jgi:hypothetical protein
MHEVEIFFCQFPNPWTLRVSGMGGYASKCEKKSQNHCTLVRKVGKRWGGGGCSQQMTAHNDPYSSFSLSFCPLCIQPGFDKKFGYAVQNTLKLILPWKFNM